MSVTKRFPAPSIVVPVCIEKDETGYYGYSPALKGLYVGGMTREEVRENLTTAVRLNIASYLKHGERLPTGCTVGCGIPVSDALSRGKTRLNLTDHGPSQVECEEIDLVVSV